MMLKICFICKQYYIPRHQTKYEAYISGNKESREQWLSGCCSNKCWDSMFIINAKPHFLQFTDLQKHDI